jgi:hypothetical protein
MLPRKGIISMEKKGGRLLITLRASQEGDFVIINNDIKLRVKKREGAPNQLVYMFESKGDFNIERYKDFIGRNGQKNTKSYLKET